MNANNLEPIFILGFKYIEGIIPPVLVAAVECIVQGEKPLYRIINYLNNQRIFIERRSIEDVISLLQKDLNCQFFNFSQYAPNIENALNQIKKGR